MKSSMLVWLTNQLGNEECALYLGAICVGEIQYLSNINRWCGWVMINEEGFRIGYFNTAPEARMSVESAVLKSLPSELSMLVEASMAS